MNTNESSKKNREEQLINELYEFYGGQDEFKSRFSDEKIKEQIIRNEKHVYVSKRTPSLYLVENAYGYAFLIHWLSLQIEEINTASAIPKKMEVKQVIELAKNIYLKYPNLKVTEVILYVFKMKCCDYGEFFGCIDPLKIMSALTEFVRERNQIMINFQLKQELLSKEQKRQSWKQDSVTREEYLNMVKTGKYKPQLKK